MSLNAAAIAVMVERGLTASDILAVAEALEIKKDPTGAERQARYRERKAAERNEVTRDVTRDESDVTPFPLAPPLKNPPDPKKITPPISPNPTNEGRARRLPPDWQPEPLTGKAKAMVEVWPPGEVERELAKFRNYWLAKAGRDACKTDWQRTWINWLISADERKPRNGPQQSNGLGRDKSSDGLSPTTRAAIAVFGPPAGQPRPVPQ